MTNMETIYRNLVEGREEVARLELSAFLGKQFGLAPEGLKFLQSEVSLNSFKGEFVAAGVRYFFKTHIENAGEVAEYAGAKLLEEAGYPIIAPVFACSERGRELLVYPFIDDVSLFEIVAMLNRGQDPDVEFQSLRAAQNELDQRVFEIYQSTFAAVAPERFPDVQQLFYRRLEGERFENFYRGKARIFAGKMRSFEDLEAAEWVVNGRSYGRMGKWLDQARRLLSPEAILPFTVVGHGDAHNGNVFYGKDETGRPQLRLFDPAYGGRMDPFLDLTKPLFHNTFARWMYFPEEVAAQFELDARWEPGRFVVDHDFTPGPVAQMFFESKRRYVLEPLIAFLQSRGVLPDDWKDRLRASLLCCPLLTVNLFDEKKYSPAMSALGFALVAEMANLDFNF